MPDLEVDLSIITQDGLRKITIVLIKETVANGVNWTLKFALAEKDKKEDANFKDPLIDLTVKIKPSVFAKAQETADNGLESHQESQAHIAAAAGKKESLGQVSKAFVSTQVQKIVSVRPT